MLMDTGNWKIQEGCTNPIMEAMKKMTVLPKREIGDHIQTVNDGLSDLAKKLLLELREIKSEVKQVRLIEQFLVELLIERSGVTTISAEAYRAAEAEIVEDPHRKNTSITEPLFVAVEKPYWEKKKTSILDDAIEALQVEPKRFNADRFEELKQFLLNKRKE